MTETATEKVVKQITGRCVKTEESNGWTAFSIDTGSQYPTRLSTKLQKLIEEARSVGQETATWTYTETESDRVNPNSGQKYKNRYLDKVEVSKMDDLHIKAASSSDGGMSKDDWARKDSAIHLMACIKAASAALTHTMPADPSEEDLGKFIRRVGVLTDSWHQQILFERSGEEVPFA